MSRFFRKEQYVRQMKLISLINTGVQTNVSLVCVVGSSTL